jgi:hypothetical protein
LLDRALLMAYRGENKLNSKVIFVIQEVKHSQCICVRICLYINWSSVIWLNLTINQCDQQEIWVLSKILRTMTKRLWMSLIKRALQSCECAHEACVE